jgi:hypothetical protein
MRSSAAIVKPAHTYLSLDSWIEWLRGAGAQP